MVEQGFTRRMAVNTGDNEIASEVLREHCPRRCNALAKKIKNLNWSEDDEKSVKVGPRPQKIPCYREKLVETEGKRLVECTKDRKWA